MCSWFFQTLGMFRVLAPTGDGVSTALCLWRTPTEAQRNQQGCWQRLGAVGAQPASPSAIYWVLGLWQSSVLTGGWKSTLKTSEKQCGVLSSTGDRSQGWGTPEEKQTQALTGGVSQPWHDCNDQPPRYLPRVEKRNFSQGRWHHLEPPQFLTHYVHHSIRKVLGIPEDKFPRLKPRESTDKSSRPGGARPWSSPTKTFSRGEGCMGSGKEKRRWRQCMKWYRIFLEN